MVTPNPHPEKKENLEAQNSGLSQQKEELKKELNTVVVRRELESLKKEISEHLNTKERAEAQEKVYMKEIDSINYYKSVEEQTDKEWKLVQTLQASTLSLLIHMLNKKNLAALKTSPTIFIEGLKKESKDLKEDTLRQATLSGLSKIIALQDKNPTLYNNFFANWNETVEFVFDKKFPVTPPQEPVQETAEEETEQGEEEGLDWKGTISSIGDKLKDSQTWISIATGLFGAFVIKHFADMLGGSKRMSLKNLLIGGLTGYGVYHLYQRSNFAELLGGTDTDEDEEVTDSKNQSTKQKTTTPSTSEQTSTSASSTTQKKETLKLKQKTTLRRSLIETKDAFDRQMSTSVKAMKDHPILSTTVVGYMASKLPLISVLKSGIGTSADGLFKISGETLKMGAKHPLGALGVVAGGYGLLKLSEKHKLNLLDKEFTSVEEFKATLNQLLADEKIKAEMNNHPALAQMKNLSDDQIELLYKVLTKQIKIEEILNNEKLPLEVAIFVQNHLREKVSISEKAANSWGLTSLSNELERKINALPANAPEEADLRTLYNKILSLKNKSQRGEKITSEDLGVIESFMKEKKLHHLEIEARDGYLVYIDHSKKAGSSDEKEIRFMLDPVITDTEERKRLAKAFVPTTGFGSFGSATMFSHSFNVASETGTSIVNKMQDYLPFRVSTEEEFKEKLEQQFLLGATITFTPGEAVLNLSKDVLSAPVTVPYALGKELLIFLGTTYGKGDLDGAAATSLVVESATAITPIIVFAALRELPRIKNRGFGIPGVTSGGRIMWDTASLMKTIMWNNPKKVLGLAERLRTMNSVPGGIGSYYRTQAKEKFQGVKDLKNRFGSSYDLLGSNEVTRDMKRNARELQGSNKALSYSRYLETLSGNSKKLESYSRHMFTLLDQEIREKDPKTGKYRSIDKYGNLYADWKKELIKVHGKGLTKSQREIIEKEINDMFKEERIKKKYLKSSIEFFDIKSETLRATVSSQAAEIRRQAQSKSPLRFIKRQRQQQLNNPLNINPGRKKKGQIVRTVGTSALFLGGLAYLSSDKAKIWEHKKASYTEKSSKKSFAVDFEKKIYESMNKWSDFEKKYSEVIGRLSKEAFDKKTVIDQKKLNPILEEYEKESKALISELKRNKPLLRKYYEANPKLKSERKFGNLAALKYNASTKDITLHIAGRDDIERDIHFGSDAMVHQDRVDYWKNNVDWAKQFVGADGKITESSLKGILKMNPFIVTGLQQSGILPDNFQVERDTPKVADSLNGIVMTILMYLTPGYGTYLDSQSVSRSWNRGRYGDLLIDTFGMGLSFVSDLALVSIIGAKVGLLIKGGKLAKKVLFVKTIANLVSKADQVTVLKPLLAHKAKLFTADMAVDVYYAMYSVPRNKKVVL